MNHNSKSSRRSLARLGESTNNILSFQDDMMTRNFPPAAEEVPTARLRVLSKSRMTATDQPLDPALHSKGKVPGSQRKKKNARVTTEHKDICLPPLCGRESFRHESVISCIDEVVQQPSPGQWHRTMVSVFPGHYVPMVGSRETMEALERQCCSDTACVQCETFLHCSDLACMVLCPICHFISPVSDKDSQMEILGLGLTVEQILEARIVD